MHRPSIGIRTALFIYASALHLAGRSAIASRRGDMLLAFHDACVEAGRRRGIVGIYGRTLSELWDLVRATLAPRRRATDIVDHRRTSSTPPRASRGWTTDIRHAMRALVARRFDTALTVGLLAIGLATTSSIFAVADALLLNPIPFQQPDRLVQVWSTSGQSSFTSVPRDLAVRWLDRTDLFSAGGVYSQTSALVTSGGDPEVISAVEVSPGLFETLGVRPILGRNFVADEGGAGTNHVVIIGADIWASRFGKAPDVIGRTLKINAIDHRVVGVMAPEFRFPYSRQRIWLPFDFRNPAPEQVRSQVTLVARMHPRLTREHVTAQVKAAGPEMAKLAPNWKMGATTRYMDEVLMDPQTRRSIWMLFGATVLIMLTVCANVANLGLSQAFSRVRDAAIRSALGASRWRMIRQMLVEQLAVGALALLIALPLTAGAIELATGLLPLNYTLSSLNPLDIDARLLAMMAALALTAPLLSGLIPAIVGSRPSVLSALKQESRSVAGSRGARWFRKGLVVLEVACSVVLLVSAALLVRSFIRLQAVETGFDSRNLVSVNLGFPVSAFADNIGRGLYLDQAVERLRQLPGVRAATSASGVPPDSGGIHFGDVETDVTPSSKTELIASRYDVHPEFFETMGMRLLAGRAFTAGESEHHVIVGENFAAKLWPGQSAVGRKFRWEKSTWNEVVGVVSTVREGAGRGSDEAFPQYYIPEQMRVASTAPPRDAIPEWRRLAVRVTDPAAAMPQIRAALKNLNPGILIQSVDLVDDQLAKELERPRFLLVLMLVFAGAGLVLAAVGVYGVLSCLVAEQLREYGIRLMLGASPSAISRQIVVGGLTTTIVGLVIGVGAAAALGQTINSVLFQVDAYDVTSYVIVGVVLVAAALAAAWRPARRARSVDPAALLRAD